MTEPRTEAGRRLLAVMATVPPDGRKGLAYFVSKIEAEAIAAYAADLRAKVEGLCAPAFAIHEQGRWYLREAAVLRLLDPEGSQP